MATLVRSWLRQRALPSRRVGSLLGLLLLVVIGLPCAALAHPAAAPTFANGAFAAVWARTDQPVAAHTVTRGYFWGPGPGVVKQEAYVEGSGGARLVQYFDKSRMELNDPTAAPSNPFYVTNGLLTVELVSGRLQVGNTRFIVRYPAQIPLASDTDDATAPTYASFSGLLGNAAAQVGQATSARVDRAGKTTPAGTLATDPAGKVAYYEPATGHNIPAAFWQFLNRSGPIVQNGSTVTGRLSDPWFYAAGYPITEAYWANVKIAGQANTLVLVQLFQRRVLTYVPSAPAAFQVQAGNIGQHYYDWRYNGAGKPAATATTVAPTPTAAPTLGPTGLTVFAASSLKESFTEAGRAFKVAHPNVTDLQFNFAGSQQLVAQLSQGAPADVFASADKANMDKAVAAGVIDGSPQELARNALVVVVPNDNPAGIHTLHDLGRPGVKLSLADPSVPVGNYSGQALDKLAADPAYGAAFKTQVLDNVVSREDNVRQVLTRVQLGEVDAGIVYLTDAQAANAGAGGSVPPVQTLAIPTQYNVIAVYYVAAVKDAPHGAAAHAWLDYVLSPAGQATLTKYGFGMAGGGP